jgi:hypothetical protein
MWRQESVTIAHLHRLFAVSISPSSTAAVKGWMVQTGGTTMAMRQMKAGWIERLKYSFHRFWNE